MLFYLLYSYRCQYCQRDVLKWWNINRHWNNFGRAHAYTSTHTCTHTHKILGIIRIKCIGQNILNTNHLKNLAISGLLGLIRADSDVLLAVVHPLSNGGGRLVFYAGSKAPPSSSSWGHPGTERGLPAPTSPLWNRKKFAVAVFGK